MTRDYGQEIDELKKEISDLKKLLPASNADSSEGRRVGRIGRSGIDPNFPLKANTYSCSGYYDNGISEGAQWQHSGMSIVNLLNMDDNKTARVLSALGNKERLLILKQVLEKPMTVNELVEALNLGTTGKAYHHLNALLAADFIKNESGKYYFHGHRVSGLIMILAGVDTLLDETFTKGNIDEL